MDDRSLAVSLLDFFGGLPDFWKDLREVVENKLAVVGKKAEQLSQNIFSSKDKFVNTLIDLIFVLKKTPKIFQPVFRWILKGVIMFLLDKLDKDWFENIKKKIGLIKISNARVTFLPVA